MWILRGEDEAVQILQASSTLMHYAPPSLDHKDSTVSIPTDRYLHVSSRSVAASKRQEMRPGALALVGFPPPLHIASGRLMARGRLAATKVNLCPHQGPGGRTISDKRTRRIDYI